MKKSQKILVGVLLVLLTVALFFIIGSFSNSVFERGNENSVKYVSEELSVVNYEVTTQGTIPISEFFPESDKIIKFQSSTGIDKSDSIARSDNVPQGFASGYTPYKRDVQTIKYSFDENDAFVSGIIALINADSPKRKEISYKIIFMKGFCEPKPQYQTNLDCGRFDGQYRCSVAQGFNF